MSVSERIRIILEEKQLNQKQFAASIFVTGGYISRLLKGEMGISNTTALLIERIHGYAKDWVLHGKEPKLTDHRPDRELTPTQKKIIAEIEKMSDDELFFIATYIEALKKKKAKEQNTDA
jgi:transcriptional regulator with XRE-family HTH domain